MDSIGSRVLETIKRDFPERLQREIAEEVGMTPDAFSRALGDKRQFSSIELARLAEVLSADLHWLITGEADPNRLVVAARHDYDFQTRRRDVPGREGDAAILEDIALAYRQVFRTHEAAAALPDHAEKARDVLGEEFVRPLARRLEECLGVDVVRVPELSTAYSFTLGGRRVIALRATGNWFWENWSMAHELGHLALGHHEEQTDPLSIEAAERAANSFAAELLMPTEVVTDLPWDALDDSELAALVWRWGVSIDALANRLDSVLGQVPEVVERWSGNPTQRLLRRNLQIPSEIDEITRRMDEASQRRFPIALQEAHLAGIASGAVGKGTLAWMLGIDPDALEVDSPELIEATEDDLAEALGL